MIICYPFEYYIGKNIYKDTFHFPEFGFHFDIDCLNHNAMPHGIVIVLIQNHSESVVHQIHHSVWLLPSLTLLPVHSSYNTVYAIWDCSDSHCFFFALLSVMKYETNMYLRLKFLTCLVYFHHRIDSSLENGHVDP